MKTYITLIVALSITACAHGPKPIIDDKGMSDVSKQAFAQDTKECKALALKSTSGRGMAILGAFAGDHSAGRRIDEQERVIVQECLKGRGYAVLY